MSFDRSSQAKSWLFDEASLLACREKAVVYSMEGKDTGSISDRVQRFAAGFHWRSPDRSSSSDSDCPPITNPPEYNPVYIHDQETLVKFHAHQIQTLIGPSSLLLDLRTNETVVSTAITFLRRFYLSNSVIEINPRKIAVACAFFAAKAEEQKVEIGLLSHATALVQERVRTSPLCYQELRAVSVDEILAAERLLMEGLNYEFRCHHAGSYVRPIVSGFSAFDTQSRDDVESFGMNSPRASSDYVDNSIPLVRTASEVAQRALIFSDAPFLFKPSHTALAIAAIVCGSVTKDWRMGKLQDFVALKYPKKTKEELHLLSKSVRHIIYYLVNCPAMDLRPTNGRAGAIATKRGEELRHVLKKVCHIRHVRSTLHRNITPPLKRSRFELEFSPPMPLYTRKYARVTPTGGGRHCCYYG